MKKILAALLLLAVLFGAGCSGTTERAADLDVEEFSKLVDGGAVVLDVRTPSEFQAGRLAGAQNIDVESPDFADKVADLDAARTYAVYCRSGNRSKVALALMEKAGIKDASHLEGGINAWAAAGKPVES